jgi:alpha-amylase/alpha-mannosidase (GH57 family)
MKDKIQLLEIEIKQAKETRLRKAGWRYTCATPGSYWLWEKKLEDGRTILVDESFAHTLQDQLDADKQDYGDDSNARG